MSTDNTNYDEGSPGGDLSEGCSPEISGEDCICRIADGLESAIGSIAQSQAMIAETLNEYLQAPCDSIDDCADKILAKIRENVEGPLYAVSECKRLASIGMAGTVEYAVRCAHLAADKCDAICSLGDEQSEGACCNTCGQSPCVCVAGECVPAGPTEEQQATEQQFAGYCKPGSELIIVQPAELPPPTGYNRVALGANESAVREAAGQYCVRQSGGFIPVDIPASRSSSTLYCNLDAFSDKSFYASLSNQIDAANVQAAGFAITNAVSDIGIAGLSVGDLGQIIQGLFSGVTRLPLSTAAAIANPLSNMIGCNDETWRKLFAALVNVNVFGKFLGMDLTQYTTPYQYAMNYICPQGQIGVDKAVTCYLGNTIDGKDLRTLWNINGFCDFNLESYVNAVRRKPDPLPLAIMRHREIISDSEYSVKMRELGFTDPQDSERLYDITNQVPVLSDIIRFMVRDTDDSTLVEKFGLDTAFEQKFGRQLKRWALDQGIPELYAKYAWRSHWQIPSPGQLFEFYHRLRYTDKFGPPDKLLGEIKAALIQQDILPFWHDYYLATSFRPMRLRDLRRSFQVGSLTESELFDGYIQLGYSDETAGRMRDYTIRLRDDSLVNHTVVKQWARFERSRDSARATLIGDGFPESAIDRAFNRAAPTIATSSQAKAFVKGLLTRQQFEAILTQQGVDPAAVQSLVAGLSVRRVSHDALNGFAIGRVSKPEAIQRMIDDGMDQAIVASLIDTTENKIVDSLIVGCQKAAKRRFVMGELTSDETIGELTKRGTTAERARLLVSWWECELRSGRREVSASKLCDWLGKGAINSVQFLERLVKIGYDRQDAEIMLSDCLTAVNEKRLREAAKAAKDQAAADEKLRRKAEQAAASVERERVKLANMRARAASLKLSREKALYAIAKKLNDAVRDELPAVLSAITSEVNRVKREFGLSQDQALQVLALAADQIGSDQLSAFADVINTVAEKTLQDELTDAAKQVYIPESNGVG